MEWLSRPGPVAVNSGGGRGEAHISCSPTHTHTDTHCLLTQIPEVRGLLCPHHPPGQGVSRDILHEESTLLPPPSLWSRGHTNEPHYLTLVTEQNLQRMGKL